MNFWRWNLWKSEAVLQEVWNLRVNAAIWLMAVDMVQVNRNALTMLRYVLVILSLIIAKNNTK